MLRTLAIRSFAIIDHLEVEFGPGLNVLTGETGAGKSILLGALTAILGGRAGADVVRTGADRATIDAQFDVTTSPDVCGYILAAGFPMEGGDLLLSREVAANGKSLARICGRPATAGQLREVGEFLVDLHGQHEHQSLLSVPRHLDMLDSWGGAAALELRGQAAALHQRVGALKGERAGLESDARERERQIDLLRFQCEEIEQAGLDETEEPALDIERNRLANGRKLSDAAEAAAAAINSEEGGGLTALAEAVRTLSSACDLDPALDAISQNLQEALYSAEEALRDLSRYPATLEFNPVRLQQLDDRLDLIARLKRKYGENIAEVLTFWADSAQRLDRLLHAEERREALDAQIVDAEKQRATVCNELTDLRVKLAKQFGSAVEAELKELAMPRTRFEVSIEPEEPGPRGADHVEMLLAPNPGEQLRPLARIASGGEISRVMLAIKSAVARQEPLPTMVFDEIDAGVGGRTGSVLADKLNVLAAGAQIICITHLPQIAARGTRHYAIEKQIGEKRTSTTVRLLGESDRVDEIARMLGGTAITDAVVKHAREMLASG